MARRRLAFFAGALAAFSVVSIACSGGGSGDAPGSVTNAEGGPDGAGGGDGGWDGAPFDAGPPPYGTVPPGPPVNYTCAGEIHVSTTGNDSTGDGTAANAYRTIAKGAGLAKAGDCIKVHAGTYAETATVTFTTDGTSGQPIVLVSVDGRGAAIIDGASNTTGPAIEVKNDYVVIDGFEIKNTPQTVGLHVVRFDGMNAGKCVGSVLRNSKITGGFSQLKVYQKTQGVLVEHNELYGKSGNVPLSLTGASGLVFRANDCHDWDSGDDSSAQLAGGSKDVLFENNLFQDVKTLAGAIALGDDCGATCDNDPDHYGAVNAKAINNIFIRAVRAFDVRGCKNCSILSNTIIDSGLNEGVVFKFGSAITNGTSRSSTGTRILDNLVTSPGSAMGYVMYIDGASGDGLQMDYNLFFNGPKGVSLGETHPPGADSHSVQGNPLLIGPTDFHPGAGSPAIGAGTNLAAEVPQDFLGVARPVNGPFDIGAIQH